MSKKVVLSKINETYMKVHASEDVYHELYEAFSFFVPNAKFHPKVKAKLWDGQIHMLNLRTKLIYVGLFSKVYQYLKENDYEVGYDFQFKDPEITPEIVMDYIKSLNIHSDSNPLSFRDYQYYAVFLGLKYYRRTILSPTASGKSAIIYAIIRYLLDNTEGKILLTVTTTQLAHQMLSDFVDYSSHNGFDAEENCHIIMQGKEKNSHKRVYISVWNSIYKLDEAYFYQFESIIGDEFHQAKAECMKGIYEKSTKARYRLGFTGTTNKISTDELVIQGLTGDITRVATTKELMDKGYLAKLTIKNYVLQYSDEHRKQFKSLLKSKSEVDKQRVYDKEIEFLTSYTPRNKFIVDLAIEEANQGKNVLIIFRYIERHGDLLHQEFLKRNVENLYYIHGKNTEAEERDELRKIINNCNGSITIASENMFSTGTNIKNLHVLIFGMPSKSIIKILQSIGRTLRITNTKKECIAYDIGDDISNGKTKNYALLHNIERLKIYNSEKFDYEIINKEI